MSAADSNKDVVVGRRPQRRLVAAAAAAAAMLVTVGVPVAAATPGTDTSTGPHQTTHLGGVTPTGKLKSATTRSTPRAAGLAGSGNTNFGLNTFGRNFFIIGKNNSGVANNNVSTTVIYVPDPPNLFPKPETIADGLGINLAVVGSNTTNVGNNTIGVAQGVFTPDVNVAVVGNVSKNSGNNTNGRTELRDHRPQQLQRGQQQRWFHQHRHRRPRRNQRRGLHVRGLHQPLRPQPVGDAG